MNQVTELLENVDNEHRKADALELLSIMEEASGYKPHLQGNMVGFGSYHYKYESGTEGDMFITGFAPRKQNLAVYIMPGFSEIQADLNNLGKHKTGKSCLYLNKLSDVDTKVLAKIISDAVKVMQERYVCQALPPA